MSIQAIAYAIDLREGPFRDPVTPQEKLLLILLANRINPDHGNRCWPSISTIAEEMGRSERRVQELLDSLEGKGLVSRKEHHGVDGAQKTSSYRLPDMERGRSTANPGDGRDEDEEAREQEAEEAARRRDADERAALSSPFPRKRDLAPPGADSITPRGADGVTPPVRSASPPGADSFTLNVRGTVEVGSERETQEEPQVGASANASGSQENVHAEHARPTPIPVVEDDFVPIEVERERERAERRAAREERERVEAEQHTEVLRERERRRERQVRVVLSYLEQHDVPPTTTARQQADLLVALHAAEDPEQQLSPVHRIPWVLVDQALRERGQQAVPA